MNTLIKIVIGLLLIIGAAALIMSSDSGENTGSSAETDDIVTVAVSFYPLQFLAEQIGGNQVQIINVGSNADPHDFEPTARDIQTVIDADIFLAQGGGLEPWIESMEEQRDALGKVSLVINENVELFEEEKGNIHTEHEDEHMGENHMEHEDDDHEEDHEEEHEGHDHHNHGADPHTWLDFTLFGQAAGLLSDELSNIDPAQAELFRANTESFQVTLSTLAVEYEEALGSCALEEVITTHDAFGYVARAYDFEIHTIAGLSTQGTPSVETLAELREEAEEGVGAILLEENAITAYGETLARETGLATYPINPAAFGVSGEADYMSIMRANLDSFSRALQCE